MQFFKLFDPSLRVILLGSAFRSLAFLFYNLCFIFLAIMIILSDSEYLSGFLLCFYGYGF